MPFRLGPAELIIVLVIVMVVFGAGKLGQVGSSLGKGIREFRKGVCGKDEEDTQKMPISRNGRWPYKADL